MFANNFLKVKFFYKDKELDLDNGIINSFKIHISHKKGFYFFEVFLKSDFSKFLVSKIFKTGMVIDLNVEFVKRGVKRDIRCFIYYKFLFNGLLDVVLYPLFFIDCCLKKHSIVKKDNVNNIVELIINKMNFKEYEFEKGNNFNKVYFYLINLSYFDMLRYILLPRMRNVGEYGIANYCFSIDINDKLLFIPYKKILNKKGSLILNDMNFEQFQMEDLRFDLNEKDGFGDINYYFDWGSGEYKKSEIIFSDLKDKLKFNYINKKGMDDDYNKIISDIKSVNGVNLVNGYSIGIDGYYLNDDDNKILSEYRVLTKNYFNLVIKLTTTGIDFLNIFDVVEVNFSEDVENLYGLNGNWVVLDSITSYTLSDLTNELILTNNYYY